MSRFLLLFILSSFLAIPCFAQKGALGLRAGAAFTSYYGDDINKDNIESAATITGGFYINTMLFKYFWLKHDFMYVNRKNIQAATAGKNLTTNQHYIDVYPISPAFHFLGLQAFAGPALSVLVAFNEEQIKTDNNGNILIEENKDTENRNILEWGIMAGVEFEAPFGLNAGARYVRGLTNVNNIDDPNLDSVYNQAFLFTIGWTFRQKSQKENN